MTTHAADGHATDTGLPGYGGLLREGWTLYFAVLPQWIALALPLLILSALLDAWAGDGTNNVGRSMLVALPVSLLGAFATGGLQWMLWQARRGGELSTAELWAQAARRVPAVWGYGILVACAVLFGTVLFVLPGLWVMTRLVYAQLAANVAAEEGMPLSVSFDLTRGRFWWTLGFVAMLVVVALLAAVPCMIVRYGAEGMWANAASTLLLTLAVGPLSAALLVAFDELLLEREALRAPVAPGWAAPLSQSAPPVAAQTPQDEAPAAPPAPPAGDEELPRGGASAPFE